MRRHSRLPAAAALMALVALAASCNAILGPDSNQLRVRNVGTLPIVGLTVLYPGGEASYEPIPPGATTPYRVVAGGVYGYAAFEFDYQGERVMQPVIDWVGESPLTGSHFTTDVRLEIDPDGRPYMVQPATRRDRSR